MIIQVKSWMGMSINSAMKITSYKVTPVTSTTNDIEITINRYTDTTCVYDMEQFTKTFRNVSTSIVPIGNISAIETILVLESDMAGATIV